MSNQPSTKTFSSGGSFAAQHKVPRTLPIFVAPTVTDELNTVRVALVAVACWRVNHVLFGFDSSFVVPEIREELKELAALVRANPESPASVFGHADPVGDDDFNKPLSGRRAQAIFALLTRNVDMWEELHRDSHGADDWGLKSIQVFVKSPFGPDIPHSYVHAKTWIFDDQFAIIGSANTNQRGWTHDSEICAGIYDESTNDHASYSFAHRLRVALWAEHLNMNTADGHAQLADGVASAANWLLPGGNVDVFAENVGQDSGFSQLAPLLFVDPDGS